MVRTVIVGCALLGVISCFGSELIAEPLGWKSVAGTRIPLPPAHRPRLYLGPEHVPQLRGRREHPALAEAVARLETLAGRKAQFRLEWDAVEYLIEGDREKGRQTVAAAFRLLEQTVLPDRNDACRVTGRMMVTAAIVYDWLYDLLSEEQKRGFIQELIRLAKTLECGYPPTRQGSVTGHSSEAMIMRDLLSAGIAVYDEYPEMYELAAGRFFREHLPARNWLYEGHAYHQGDSYGPYRFGWDTFPLWIFDRLGAGNVYNPEQAQVPYRWVYTTRPDGQRLRAGDTFLHSRPRGTPWGVGAGTMLAASYYGDGTLLSHYLAQGGNRDNEVIFEYLWRDVTLMPKSIAELPRTRYFGSPFGWMVARTGWDEHSVIAEMKVNEFNFANHQHLDAGAFQIYYRGGLAIDSGVYTGSSGRYGSPHCRNYYWRTIAHNSLLVHDPQEDFGSRNGYGNDGGQRLPNGRREPRTLEMLRDPDNGYRTGTVLAQGFGPSPQTPDYSILKGDLTAAYGDKVDRVTRSWVFLNLGNASTPAAVIVYDRIVARSRDDRKYWLLHCLDEPRVSGDSVVIDARGDGEGGRLVLETLLPGAADRDLELIGGPGREYWVFGRNYPNEQQPDHRQRTSMELGAWRVQLSPRQASRDCRFLNVMQITNREDGEIFPVARVAAGPFVGCCLAGPGATWTVLFHAEEGRIDQPFSIQGGSDAVEGRLLLTDLEPGTWHARDSDGQTVAVQVSDASAAWLTLGPGVWEFRPGPSE